MVLHNPHTRRGPRFPLCLITVIGLLLLSPVVTAQETQPDDVIRVRTDFVVVPVIVTDPNGRRIFGLQADDFALSDDNHPAKIDYLASGTEHVAMLFALDASGSARDILAPQRDAALALFSRFGQGSRVAVLHFGDFVRLSIPFTSDSAAAKDSLQFIAAASGGTAIFDGAAAAVRSFDGSGGFSTERRIVLLMSDGLDTLSSTSYLKVISAARDRSVSFYVIHFLLFTPRDGRLAPRPPSRGFRELAEQTGGRYFRVGDAKSALDPHAHYDLTQVFQAIDNDLRGQYVLGFYPNQASRDGHPHRITVSLSKRMSRKIRVKQLRTSYSLEATSDEQRK